MNPARKALMTTNQLTAQHCCAKPCPTCPFRMDKPKWLSAEWVTMNVHFVTDPTIMAYCHETRELRTPDECHNPKAKFCAGFLLFTDKVGIDKPGVSKLLVAELDKSIPVYETLSAFILDAQCKDPKERDRNYELCKTPIELAPARHDMPLELRDLRGGQLYVD